MEAWSDGQGQDVEPLSIWDREPLGSWNCWSLALAGAVHQHPQITKLGTDVPAPIGGFEEVEALGSLDCVSLVVGQNLVVVSVVDILDPDRERILPT